MGGCYYWMVLGVEVGLHSIQIVFGKWYNCNCGSRYGSGAVQAAEGCLSFLFPVRLLLHKSVVRRLGVPSYLSYCFSYCFNYLL